MDALAEANSVGSARGIQICSALKGKMGIVGGFGEVLFYFYRVKTGIKKVHLIERG